MVYRNGRLVEATVDELLELYLNDSMDRVMDFGQYLTIIENNGCTIKSGETEPMCKTCMIEFGGND